MVSLASVMNHTEHGPGQKVRFRAECIFMRGGSAGKWPLICFRDNIWLKVDENLNFSQMSYGEKKTCFFPRHIR